MAEQQFKRNVAHKIRIGELFLGKPIFDQEKFSFLELGEKRIIRVNLIGNIVDKFESSGENKYLFFTLDDGSGQIKIKVFGEDVEKFRKVNQGQTVVVIGLLRNWNDEVYLNPEIIREMNTKYLLIRKLELEKDRSKKFPEIKKKEIIALKDDILEKIKASEKEGGIDQEKIILDFREVPSEIINSEIKRLLEEGIIFEPRPGKLRYLG